MSRLAQAPATLGKFLQAYLGSEGQGTAGVAAIEFAIAVPLLLMFAICTFDIGMGFYRKAQVENAAQAGAQYALLHGFNVSAIQNAVTASTSNPGVSASPSPSQFCGCASSSGISSAPCNSTCPSGATAGMYVSVSAQANYTPLISYPLFADSFNFTATSTLRVQ